MDITTWEWTKASGLTSFFLLFLSVFVGLLHRAPIFSEKVERVIVFLSPVYGMGRLFDHDFS